MAFNIFNRVLETARNDGSGNCLLLGKQTGYQAFADRLSPGDTTYYEINDGANWEVGLGTLVSSTLLARTTVFKSSAGDGSITLSGNNFNVFITMPAEKYQYIAPDGSVGNADGIRNTIVIDTIGNMQGLTPAPANGTSIYVRSLSTATGLTDGQGDWFTWDNTDASTPDNINSFISTVLGSGQGLYKRQLKDTILRTESSLDRDGEMALVNSKPILRVNSSTEYKVHVGLTAGIFGYYDTLLGLTTIDAAASFQDGDHIILRGNVSVGDFSGFRLYKWNSSSSITGVQLDSVNWIRPTTGSASTGNGRWELIYNLDASAQMTGGDPTPSVAHKDILITDGSTSITDFDDGFEGQKLTVIWGGVSSINIIHNANIIASNSQTTVMGSSLRSSNYVRRNGVWYQVSNNLQVIDEDDFSSDSQHQPASQQSTKQYIADQFTANVTDQKGANNGLASLDGSGKLSSAQLPDSIVGTVEYLGTWNASTNTPTIPAAASGNTGDYYRVSVAGTTNIDGITDWGVGDWIISNGTVWEKIDNSQPDADDTAFDVSNIGSESTTLAPSRRTVLQHTIDEHIRIAGEVGLVLDSDTSGSVTMPARRHLIRVAPITTDGELAHIVTTHHGGGDIIRLTCNNGSVLRVKHGITGAGKFDLRGYQDSNDEIVVSGDAATLEFKYFLGEDTWIYQPPIAQADIVRVKDTAGNFTGTNVEAILAELAASGGGGGGGAYEVIKMSEQGFTGSGNEITALRTLLTASHTNIKVFVFDVHVRIDFTGESTINLGGPQIWVNPRNDRLQGLNIVGCTNTGNPVFFRVDEPLKIIDGLWINCANIPDVDIPPVETEGIVIMFDLRASLYMRDSTVNGKQLVNTATNTTSDAGSYGGVVFCKPTDDIDIRFIDIERSVFTNLWRIYFTSNTHNGFTHYFNFCRNDVSTIGKSGIVVNMPGASERSKQCKIAENHFHDCAMHTSATVTAGAAHSRNALLADNEFTGQHNVNISLEESEGYKVRGNWGLSEYNHETRSQAFIHIKANEISGSPETNNQAIISDNYGKAIISGSAAAGVAFIKDASSVNIPDMDDLGIITHNRCEDYDIGYYDRIAGGTEIGMPQFKVSDNVFKNCSEAYFDLEMAHPGIDNNTCIDDGTSGRKAIKTQYGGTLGKLTAIGFISSAQVFDPPSESSVATGLFLTEVVWRYKTTVTTTPSQFVLMTGDFATAGTAGYSGEFYITSNQDRSIDCRAAHFKAGYTSQSGITGVALTASGNAATQGDGDTEWSQRSGLTGAGVLNIPADGIGIVSNNLVAKLSATTGSLTDVNIEVRFQGIMHIPR